MEKQEMVGILYAGGKGGRLTPYTGKYDENGIFHVKCNKQVLPLGELGTPMFGYPLAMMMRAGIKNILICTNANALNALRSYYDDGSQLGIHLTYTTEISDAVKGPSENLYAARDLGFIKDKNVCVIYGDVAIHPQVGSNLKEFWDKIRHFNHGALVATTDAATQGVDPCNYGVITRNAAGEVVAIDEKPTQTASNEIHLGVSVFDSSLSEKLDVLKRLTPSSVDGQMRETDISKLYAQEGTLDAHVLQNVHFIDCGDKKLYNKSYAYIRSKMPCNATSVDIPERVAVEMDLVGSSPAAPSLRCVQSARRSMRLGPLAGHSL